MVEQSIGVTSAERMAHSGCELCSLEINFSSMAGTRYYGGDFGHDFGSVPGPVGDPYERIGPPRRMPFRPLPYRHNTFGKRMRMFPRSGVASKAVKRAALKTLAGAAIRGAMRLEGYGLAFDVFAYGYGAIRGAYNGDSGTYYHVQDGWTCSYTCPNPPPYTQGTAMKVFGGGNCPTPSYLKCTPAQVPDWVEVKSPNTWGFNVTTFDGSVLVGPYTPVGTVDRFFVHRVYTWLNAAVKPKPALIGTIEFVPGKYIPAPDPFPEPAFNPYIPAAWPIIRLAPGFPPALPYGYAGGPTPDPHSARGYGGFGRPRPAGGGRGTRGGKFTPNSDLPNMWPTGPEWHQVKPPPARTKERKGRVPMGAFRKAVGGAYGAYTEAGDTTDSVYKALPSSVRAEDRRKNGGRPLSMAQKLGSIYKHADQVNVAAAVANIISDQAKDAVIGKANKAANRITGNPYWHRPVGHGAGSRFWPTNLAHGYGQ